MNGIPPDSQSYTTILCTGLLWFGVFGVLPVLLWAVERAFSHREHRDTDLTAGVNTITDDDGALHHVAVINGRRHCLSCGTSAVHR